MIDEEIMKVWSKTPGFVSPEFILTFARALLAAKLQTAQVLPNDAMAVLYGQAYAAGHNDTVEGCYTDVPHSYRKENWQQAAAEFLAENPELVIATAQDSATGEPVAIVIKRPKTLVLMALSGWHEADETLEVMWLQEVKEQDKLYAAPSKPTVPVCRLLTAQENYDAYKNVLDYPQSSAMISVEIQRKFCEVNGLTLTAAQDSATGEPQPVIAPVQKPFGWMEKTCFDGMLANKQINWAPVWNKPKANFPLDAVLIPVYFTPQPVIAPTLQDSATGEPVATSVQRATDKPYIDSLIDWLLCLPNATSAKDEVVMRGKVSEMLYLLAALKQPTVPVCRLLTAQESREAYKSVLDFSQSPARARAEVQRKFCEINGLTLAAPTPKEQP
jgi:hypothetical protein